MLESKTVTQGHEIYSIFSFFFYSSILHNLGEEFDNCMKFDKQFSTVVGSSFFYLHSLSKIKPFSEGYLEVAIHAFITFHGLLKLPLLLHI